jgi:nitrogen fixation NifU-like protein
MMQSFYKEIVLDHFQRPRNRHELEDATIEEHIDNPLCGDHVTIYANVSDDTLEEVSFTGRGCSISQASASMLTEQLTGASRDVAERKVLAFLQMMHTEENEDLGELAALKGVVQTPNRTRCATLAWEAMQRALD